MEKDNLEDKLILDITNEDLTDDQRHIVIQNYLFGRTLTTDEIVFLRHAKGTYPKNSKELSLLMLVGPYVWNTGVDNIYSDLIEYRPTIESQDKTVPVLIQDIKSYREALTYWDGGTNRENYLPAGDVSAIDVARFESHQYSPVYCLYHIIHKLMIGTDNKNFQKYLNNIYKYIDQQAREYFSENADVDEDDYDIVFADDDDEITNPMDPLDNYVNIDGHYYEIGSIEADLAHAMSVDN